MRPLEDLLLDARHGNSRALDEVMRMHEPLCRWVARDFFLPGADPDDVLQEARFGLLKAIRDYRPDEGASFNTFANLCVVRQVVTAVKTYARVKHSLLNGSVRVGRNEYGDEISILDLLPSPYNRDPYEVVVALEEIRQAVARYRHLSPLERKAFSGITMGIPYTDLGEQKQIDNAAQRARRKLRAA